jgi:hypothetical protein
LFNADLSVSILDLISCVHLASFVIVASKYIGYSESKYCLCISLAHPRDCPFARVQWFLLSVEKPQTPFREIHVMFMFIPVR